jgi:hypothetical protein
MSSDKADGPYLDIGHSILLKVKSILSPCTVTPVPRAGWCPPLQRSHRSRRTIFLCFVIYALFLSAVLSAVALAKVEAFLSAVALAKVEA